MGENPYGQLINYAGMEEARTSWRCDLQQDPALFCCIFWKVLVSCWRCTSSAHSFQFFGVIVLVTALCTSSPVHSLQLFEVIAHVTALCSSAHSLQPFDVDYGNQFPHPNVCVFCSKTYHHNNHSVKPYTDYTHYVLFLAFFPRWNSLLLAMPDAYIEFSRVD